MATKTVFEVMAYAEWDVFNENSRTEDGYYKVFDGYYSTYEAAKAVLDEGEKTIGEKHRIYWQIFPHSVDVEYDVRRFAELKESVLEDTV